MTLITHFSNNKISVIAGDSCETTYYGHKSLIEKVDKVFLIQDGIVGYYGDSSDVLCDLQSSNKKLLTFAKLMGKCNTLSSNNNCFSLVISTFDDNLLYKFPENIIHSIGSHTSTIDKGLSEVLIRKVFLSPTRDENMQIDLKHNESLFELFEKCFYKVYNANLNLEIIVEDSKLNELLNIFYAEIDKNSKLNKGIIASPVRYLVLNYQSKSISGVK